MISPTSSVNFERKTVPMDDNINNQNIVKLKILDFTNLSNLKPRSSGLQVTEERNKERIPNINSEINPDNNIDLYNSLTPINKFKDLTSPIKQNEWFRGTIIPSLDNKKQVYSLYSSEGDRSLLIRGIRNKNKEFSIYSDSFNNNLVGKIDINILGNFYKIFKITENNHRVLDLETKYVKI